MFVLYAGLTMLLVAWWGIGALVRRSEAPPARELTITAVWWATPFALVTPIFSRDVYSYIAQGAMTAAGIDAYLVGPAVLGGRLAANVPEIWQHTPAPYGPVFLNLASGVTQVTGDLVWPGIIGMRVLSIVGLGLLLWSVPRIARLCGADPHVALWLGVLNPLVLLHLLADAHNDAIMLGLMALGLVLALERRPALGAVVITLAALVKVSGGLALAFLVPIWAAQMTGWARWARAALGVTGIAAATTALATAVAGTGYGWVAALDTPTRAHTWLSITTDLGYVTGKLTEWLEVASVEEARHAMWLVGVGAAACVCLVLWQRSLQIGPVTALGLSLTAFVVLGPVVHPWYLLWGIIPLAAAATSITIRRAVAVVSAALVLLVLPGGVMPGLSALAGGIMGTTVVLAVVFAFTGLDRRHLWAPLAADVEVREAATPLTAEPLGLGRSWDGARLT
jgi:hypothetical protein